MESYGRMEDAYRETCLMFDESPRTIEPVEFFGMFRDFIAEWQVGVTCQPCYTVQVNSDYSY